MTLVRGKTSLEAGLRRGGFRCHVEKLGSNDGEGVPVGHGLGLKIKDRHEGRYLVFVYLTRGG